MSDKIIDYIMAGIFGAGILFFVQGCAMFCPAGEDYDDLPYECEINDNSMECFE